MWQPHSACAKYFLRCADMLASRLCAKDLQIRTQDKRAYGTGGALRGPRYVRGGVFGPADDRVGDGRVTDHRCAPMRVWVRGAGWCAEKCGR